MPRPTSKSELLEACQSNYKNLQNLIAQYSKEEINKDFPEGGLNRNIRDVLGHLHEWHVMFLRWYETGMKGEKPDMPAKGYRWKDLPELNLKIREAYNNNDFENVKEMLDESYKEVLSLIQKHSDEELFEKKRYKWTGSTSLGAYLISNTSSHYNWAIRIIKKGKKPIR